MKDTKNNEKQMEIDSEEFKEKKDALDKAIKMGSDMFMRNLTDMKKISFTEEEVKKFENLYQASFMVTMLLMR